MSRIGTDAALASVAAERVIVSSPPFSPTAALLAVTEGGKSVAVAIRPPTWPLRRVTFSLTGTDLPAMTLNSWPVMLAAMAGRAFSTDRR